MKKVLCAIDDTDYSSVAIDLSADLAKACGAELAFLAVNELLGGHGRSGNAYLWTDAQVSELLDKAVARAAKTKGLQAKAVSLRSPDVASSIVQLAADHQFDHIVIGSGGKGAMSRLLLGSVSRDVASKAHCPVTVAR